MTGSTLGSPRAGRPPPEPPFARAAMVARLEDATFDVLVIGGGITGAGVALDAANRGLDVALVEADDFGSGTSSKSSKLVHGGLRYLQQGDVGLVYQALRERQRLRRNAPHLVKVLPFLLPVLVRDGLIPRRVARALGSAMWMYDLTGGWRIGKLHRRLKAGPAHRHMPTIPRDRLAGAYLYYDATVDDARLVLAVARTAAARGAVVANRCRVTGLERDQAGRVTGAVVSTGDRTVTVRAHAVVNAAGVWADEVRSFESDGDEPVRTIRPAKGVHITVPWELIRNDIAAVIPVPGDRRSLFVVPWGPHTDGSFSHTYVGTTDTDYYGPLDRPACTAEDIDYVLAAINSAIATHISREDITGVWAGLRPLVRSDSSGRTADLSRHHQVAVSSGGVVAISGGKLTTYRAMAEDAVDAVVELLGRSPVPRRGSLRARWRRIRGRSGSTRSLPLLGAEGFVESPPGTRAAHLGDRYGTAAATIEALAATAPSWREPLVNGLPYERAEAVYAVRHEMATTLVDVLTRRTRCHLIDREATLAAAPDVADLLATELGWDAAETARQVAEYAALVEDERAAARV